MLFCCGLAFASLPRNAPFTCGYNGNRWITAAHRLGGVTASYTYDNMGQLLSAQAYEPNSTLRLNENLSYTYDASHNLASRTANDLVQTFNSDTLNQLASITRSGTLTVSGSLTGAVTALGVNGKGAVIYSDNTFATTNGLTLRDGNNLFVTAGSNAVGELVVSTITSNRLPVAVGFNYDLNGNLVGDGQRVLDYDDANRLVSVSVPNSYRSEFVHDGLGRRRVVRDYIWQAGAWVKTNETRYVCDGYLPIQERDASGNVLVTYTRGLDLSGTLQGGGGIGGLLARTDGNGSAFYHADVGGNITSLTDSSGSVVARYLHDPFGRPLGMSGPLAGPNVMRSSSMPYYEQAGIVGYPLRVYDPTLHGWTSEDPIREAGGMNLHRFVGNNPISNVDPLGLSWIGDYMDDVGKGTYGLMMGDNPGQYDQNTYGAMRAQMLGGIDRNDNVLRDSMGQVLRTLADLGQEAAKAYAGGKLAGAFGGAVCRAGRFGSPAHRAVVDDIIAHAEARDLKAVKEVMFRAPGIFGRIFGAKFADVVVYDASGTTMLEIYQVGRVTAGGWPVARELVNGTIIAERALMDVIFVPYNLP